MENFKQLISRYKGKRVGNNKTWEEDGLKFQEPILYTLFGNDSYYAYEENSEEGNMFRIKSSIDEDDSANIVLNDRGQVKIYSSLSHKYIWGKTLDNYSPHPWFPEKQIKAFEVLKLLPNAFIGDILTVNLDGLTPCVFIRDTVWQVPQLLNLTEFFKPLYK